ncbi:shikimate dehydrogenase [Streptomyces zhihengii]
MPVRPGARRAAVLGSPVAHSLSPVLHNAAYAAMGLTGRTYERFDVDEAALPGFVDALDADWAGLSLTMPLKRAVIPLLDEISETAAAVEAVNTLVFTEDGRRTGDNTDIPGMIAALHERGGEGGVRRRARRRRHRVLRAGRPVAPVHRAGHRLCAQRGRASEMRGWGERLGVDVTVADWADAAQALAAPLVVATTPAGTTDALAAAVPARPGTLFDVLYEPWPTRLAAAWAERGGAVVGGLDLLVHQAVLQCEQMTGVSPVPVEAMRTAGEQALGAR